MAPYILKVYVARFARSTANLLFPGFFLKKILHENFFVNFEIFERMKKFEKIKKFSKNRKIFEKKIFRPKKKIFFFGPIKKIFGLKPSPTQG